MSWARIRDGMRDRLATVQGLQAFDVMPATLPDRNVAVVLPGDPLFQPAGHRGKVSVAIRVVVRCTRATVKDAQDALDALIWPGGGVIAAVEGDPTLGGAVDDCAYVRVTNYGAVEGKPGSVQAEVEFVGVTDA